MGEYIQFTKAQRHRRTLRNGWQLKQTGTNAKYPEWISVKSVPTVVHMYLLKSKQIKDPFVDPNELEVEWMGESCWVYQTEFTLLTPQPGAKGQNMFLIHEVDITNLAKPGEPHKLDISFDLALLCGRTLEEIHSKHRFSAYNGENGRLAFGKVQYHWVWDLGADLKTADPWRRVHLDLFYARIVDSWLQAVVAADLQSVKLSALVHTNGSIGCSVDLCLMIGGKTVLTRQAIEVKDGLARADFVLYNPALWYPRGYGNQSIYEFVTTVSSNRQIMDTMTKKTAFRKAELVQRQNAAGQTFSFRINNIDIFRGCSCWISACTFLPALTGQEYREWLELIANVSQGMVRVWGGGTYEEDCFYDICDELDLLVWQDFICGCGSNPAWSTLLASIREEAVFNVRRFRHHPSIVLWTGNNEYHQIQEEYGLDYDLKYTEPNSWFKSNFPAQYVYEYLLSDVLANEAPSVAYWPASLFSGGKDSSGPTVGDIDQWNDTSICKGNKSKR